MIQSGIFTVWKKNPKTLRLKKNFFLLLRLSDSSSQFASSCMHDISSGYHSSSHQSKKPGLVVPPAGPSQPSSGFCATSSPAMTNNAPKKAHLIGTGGSNTPTNNVSNSRYHFEQPHHPQHPDLSAYYMQTAPFNGPVKPSNVNSQHHQLTTAQPQVTSAASIGDQYHLQTEHNLMSLIAASKQLQHQSVSTPTPTPTVTSTSMSMSTPSTASSATSSHLQQLMRGCFEPTTQQLAAYYTLIANAAAAGIHTSSSVDTLPSTSTSAARSSSK